jgi:hypothetical protein
MSVHSGEDTVKLSRMATLPGSSFPILGRTDFPGDDAQQLVGDGAQREGADGSWSYIEFIGILESGPIARRPVNAAAAILTLCDLPISVVDVFESSGTLPFRGISSELRGIGNDLIVPDMGWLNFAAGERGAFDGFGR